MIGLQMLRMNQVTCGSIVFLGISIKGTYRGWTHVATDAGVGLVVIVQVVFALVPGHDDCRTVGACLGRNKLSQPPVASRRPHLKPK